MHVQTDDLNITTDGSDGISSVLFYANEEAEVGDEAYFIAGAHLICLILLS